MRYSLFAKISLIFMITVFLAIGLTRISFLIDERTQRRNDVVAGIATATARMQALVGPILVVPYTRIVKIQKPSDKDATKTIETENRWSERLYLLPTDLDVQSNLSSEQIRRSLYHAVVFSANLSFKGRFTTEGELVKPTTPNEQIVFDQPPHLIVGISDPRGILRAPALNWAGQQFEFLPGTAEEKMPDGIQTRITGLDPLKPWSAEFSFSVDLRGTEAIDLTPVGDTTRLSIRGNWPHPSFYGQFLPETREVSDAGFAAAWATTRLATNMTHQLQTYLRGERSLDSRIGVRFMDPTDSYVQTDRAIKYGLLFIGLTFVAFFLFEILKRLAIHPLQYGLTGAALVLFYLLLLALSEHVDFAIAYGIATLGCVALLSYYLAHILGSLRWGLGFGGLIAAVFGLLYVLISLEDHALLAGSLTLFACLALAMVLTRHVDWYHLSDSLNVRLSKAARTAADSIQANPA
jgi:inner membrane protein